MAGAAAVTRRRHRPLRAAPPSPSMPRANGVTIDLRRARTSIGAAGDWDVVLAGDVCYERPMAERAPPGCALRGGGSAGAARRSRPHLSADRRPGEMARYQVPTTLELEDCTSARRWSGGRTAPNDAGARRGRYPMEHKDAVVSHQTALSIGRRSLRDVAKIPSAYPELASRGIMPVFQAVHRFDRRHYARRSPRESRASC